MNEFDKIYLSWRPGQGKGRHIVGVLEKDTENKFTFQYDEVGVDAARKDGFVSYTEFSDTKQKFNGNVLDVFAQRLIRTERSDIKSFYDFWEIEPDFSNDKFYLLGHTQGLVPTDNFEFLADYQPILGTHFLTDLARVSDKNLAANSVVTGDILRYELDRNNSHYDKAVKIYKGNTELGYIKKIHSNIFYKVDEGKLKVSVKAIDANGYIKRIFVKVHF